MATNLTSGPSASAKAGKQRSCITAVHLSPECVEMGTSSSEATSKMQSTIIPFSLKAFSTDMQKKCPTKRDSQPRPVKPTVRQKNKERSNITSCEKYLKGNKQKLETCGQQCSNKLENMKSDEVKSDDLKIKEEIVNNNVNGAVSTSAAKQARIKKPLNAFMLFMKEMRGKVMAEGVFRESSVINQTLGKKWRLLSYEEQAKYYDMAYKERLHHRLLYPTWSARQNYAKNVKRKSKLKFIATTGTPPITPLKKCRARYGLEQQDMWCKPCRIKKRCTRYTKDVKEASKGKKCAEEDNDDDDNPTLSANDTDSEEDDSIVTVLIEEFPESQLQLSHL